MALAAPAAQWDSLAKLAVPLCPLFCVVQVAKHMEKQQKEKERRAMERLHLLLPALGPTVRAVALQVGEACVCK